MRCVGPVSGMTSTGPVLAEDGTPFVNVNPAANTPGSAVPAQVFNVILQELTHLVRHAGLSPSTDDSDLEQVRKAVEALIAARRVDPEDATPTTPGIVRLATADEVRAGTDAEKAVTPAALAGHLLMQNAFIKADPDSVVFTRTAANAISLKAGTAVEVHGKAISFTTNTAVVMPTLTPGTDYAVYVCADGSVRADANFKAPVGYTAANARKIGGFHYAPGSNATAQAGGDTNPAINPYALWDLKFRPASKDPRGMTLVADSFWADIYLLGVNHNTDGTSKYGVTIADGSSPPKIPGQFGGNGSRTYSSLNWWEAAEVMQAHGKQLPSYAEFSALAYGTTEASAPGSEPQSTVLNAAYTSRWGVVQATGCMWVWGRDFAGPYGSTDWKATGGRGSTYQMSNAVILGGEVRYPSYSGGRCSNWGHPAFSAYHYISARGVCAHRILP
ncbi:hypothetical protein [Haematospirillum sp. 15-248]|uniref:phage major tropism determinant n=1 Tax=Haematospirillum sp. 15-248 TaxID=2723107 RepID=UPI001ADE6912|nr:hypothetical protein [Haematospirillum sp. 15-248]